MILSHWPSIYTPPADFISEFSKPPNRSLNAVLCSSIFNSRFSTRASFKCFCIKNENTNEPTEGFSVLASDIPWDSGSVWSTMALYLFSLHVPLSFGGLSVVARILHRPVLNPQSEALSLLAIQTLDLIGALFLLRCMAKPQSKLFRFFKPIKSSKERNWVLASTLGFGFLILLVFLTSLLADRLIGPKDVNNPILKEILLSSHISETACVLAYCITTPLLEETVYRGFLLSSLASTMEWHRAVVISSAIFSAAHFSEVGSLLYLRSLTLELPYVTWTLQNV
ncbi:hypothetical protein L1049_023731 [Liquidambar formosana]|uniref:CAAX prenyl protease 2/Lysostaphin resistance protein A-like domain-containing protein n=1 Tax=Liquidambar formosana TaxID=63359 RepID=A0AAP0RTU8_LIQFO